MVHARYDAQPTTWGCGNAREADTGYRENKIKLVSDDTISESGPGPAWTRPSRHIETSENGEAAGCSSSARSFG
jgi:hypothetical protein